MKHLLKKMALSGIANLFAERMPFNKLIGNPFHNILHGGVTASLLDVAGA